MQVRNITSSESGGLVIEGEQGGGVISYQNEFWNSPLHGEETIPGYLQDMYRIKEEGSVLSLSLTGKEENEPIQKEFAAKDLEELQKNIEYFNTASFAEGSEEFFIEISPSLLKENFSIEDYSFISASLQVPMYRLT